MSDGRWIAVLVLLQSGVPPVAAQSADAYLQSGIEAYSLFEYDRATGLLRRALARDGDALALQERNEAYAYLAAAELFLGRPDSAMAVFQRLLRHDPRYRPDALTFPPEVTTVFNAARQRVKAVRAEPPAATDLTAGRELWSVRLFATSRHDLDIAIRTDTGTNVRTLYRGPIAESLTIDWDGFDDAGRPVPSGAYRLVVLSHGSARSDGRELQIPLRIRTVSPDTLPHPAPPADSLYLPERRSAVPMVEALVGGLGSAALVWLAPRWLADGNEPGVGRVGVAGALSLAGLIGAVTHLPGARLEDNVRNNERRHEAWAAELQEVRAINAERRTHPTLRITPGAPVTLERGT